MSKVFQEEKFAHSRAFYSGILTIHYFAPEYRQESVAVYELLYGNEMDFILKLEERFNKLIEKMSLICRRIIKKITPGKYQRKYQRVNDALEEKNITYKQKILRKFLWLKKYFIRLIHILSGKKVFDLIKEYLKSFKETLTASGYKDFFLARIKTPLGLFLEAIALRLKKLTPGQIVGGVSLMTLLMISMIGMISSGDRLLRKTNIIRKPASKSQNDYALTRKDYHKLEEKQFKLNNIQLPVHFANINEMRRIDIEFALTTSNRFTRQYILNFEYLLRDHLFHQVEPVVPSFPLEEEGRAIIKQKIRKEINSFLRKQRVRGEVTDVHLYYILAI